MFSKIKKFYIFFFLLYYYSCVADNTLGRSRKYMELSGRPGPAEFYSPKWGRSSDSYNLTWKIDSYPPLEEVRLLYRRVLVSTTKMIKYY